MTTKGKIILKLWGFRVVSHKFPLYKKPDLLGVMNKGGNGDKLGFSG